MMIGVDFKVCIRDVVVGTVAEHDVVMIIGPMDPNILAYMIIPRVGQILE